MDEKRVVDYFVVAGLPDNPLPLEEYSNEAILKPEHKQDPIIDIAVINKSTGEQPPKGFTCIEKTPAGHSADLNHGSLRSPEIYLCYKRGRNKPSLTDIGVLYEGKERVMLGCEVVYMTPQGRPANVNNSNSSRIYITYRRADESAASDTLAVTDICIILGNKGETPPHAFCQIPKNLNKGMVGSDVYLCYKKSMVKTNTIAYNAGTLSRYPLEDHPNFPMPDNVPMFCLPMGATIESWSSKSQHPLPVFSTFILTGNFEKLYGAAITFYEEYPEEKLTELQKRLLGLRGPKSAHSHQTVHINKSICLLSHWPFFDAFKKFLSYLYRISIVGPHTVPLERHISHFMHEVPFPSPQRPKILVQLNHESLCLSQPEETPLTLSGASFMTLLKNLGPDNCLNVLLFVLLEHKILVHSLRPAVLTSVAEAMAAMIFPAHWQCPYIPLCPLGLSGVLSAPCPFIVGVDSRYFDLYDPPSDVTCVDLDTVTITQPERRAVNYKLLPKRPLRVLKQTLTELFETLCDMGSNCSTPEVSLEMAPLDHDSRRRRRELLIEIEIQEAFLRFMACLLKGYKQYLLPITKAPTIGTTDAASLFNMQEFLRSRDKAYHKFFQQFMKTQTFIRFIEERTFISDKDASLAFFDECCEKVDENSDEPRLIELDDSGRSELTVLITPPEPTGLPPGEKYSYNGFPELKPELFLPMKRPLLTPAKQSQCPNSPMARRTKQEIKSAQKIAQEHSTQPSLWAKCLLGHCFSLWFIHLPSYAKSTHSKTKALHTAYDVLVKMQAARLPQPDEVCYRVLMQLCGVYQQPVLAVKLLFEMKKHGIQPNAITYGFYNKAVLESRWPTSTTNAYLLWTKLRNAIIAVAQFRRALRRRSLSLYSNSESDFDVTSMDSVVVDEEQSRKKDSGLVADIEDGAEITKNKKKKKTEFVNDLIAVGAAHGGSTDVVSDRGYSSMTQEDAQSLSKAMSNELLDLDSPAGVEEKQIKAKVPEKPMIDQVDKVEKVVKDSPRRKTSREHLIGKRRVTVASFQPIDPPVDDFRQRVGSIVRRSLSSVGSNSSIGTLMGSTYGSSAGLLMTSQTSVDESVFDGLGAGDMNSNERIRRRHRSAGDNRRGRLGGAGLQNSWRTRHRSGDPNMTSIGMKKQDSAERGDENSMQGDVIEKDKLVSDLTNSSSESTTPRKNDDLEPSRMQARACLAGIAPILAPGPDILCDFEEPRTPTALSVIAETKAATSVLERTPVTENDPLGLFLETGAVNVVARSEQNSVQSPSADLLTLNLGPGGDSSTDFSPASPTILKSGTGSPTIVKSRSDSAPADMNAKAVKRNLLIDLASLDPFSDSNSECQRLFINGGEDELPERTRLHTISECSAASSGRQYRISESSNSSYHSDGEPWSPLSPQKEEANDTERAVSSPQNIAKPLMMQRSESFSEVLKLAAKNVTSRITELKQSISSSISSPTSSSKTGSSLPKAFALDQMFSDTDDISYKSWRRASEASVDYLSRSDNILEEMGQYMDAAKNLPRNSSSSKLGSSAPSQAPIEKLIPMKDLVKDLERLDTTKFSSAPSLPQSLHNIAMDVEMSSCSRCSHCNSLLYDEEIMAGWSADDSNLNTSCQFCAKRLVPFLHIYIKDWRSHNRTLLTTPSDSSESVQSIQSLPSGPSNPITNKLIAQNKVHNTSDHSVNSVRSEDGILLHLEENKSDSGDSDSPKKQEGSNLIDFSPSHLAKGPIVNNKQVERRRCTSECAPATNGTASPYRTGKDPIPDEESRGSGPNRKQPLSLDPISVPYLSPLVLRKEVENLLEQDGDSCLSKSDFVDDHPIIYWNIIWYFRRMDVSSNLPGLVLSAKCTNKGSPSNATWFGGDSRHVLIRLKWDNARIHEEIGKPMYSMWNNTSQSRTVSALLTEQTSFSKGIMHQIVQDIQCNDMVAPMKLVLKERRRVAQAGKNRHRSMYREILYLAFTACGREDIDHDAFDREYRFAFQRLSSREMSRIQPNDRPPNVGVIWCRKIFSDLKL
ncbi:C-myc promoter-binding protein-like isoform X2 [Lineus longissimus]|uniref:C-myc promoter-binding protein-like isoform X2 n=1 Tax=Lineus longissimus TaxID=88925 RepID=UPI002B4CBF41